MQYHIRLCELFHTISLFLIQEVYVFVFYEINFSLAGSFTAGLAAGCFLPMTISANKPANTRTAPNHWRGTK